MLIASIFECLFLLVAVNLLAHRLKWPEPVIGCLCVVALIFHPFLGLLRPELGYFFVPVMWLSLFLLPTLVIFRLSSRGPSFFGLLSIGAFALSFGVCGISAYRDGLEYAELREAYPYVSLEPRLKPRATSPEVKPLEPSASARLEQIEENSYGHSIRTTRLRMLHEAQVELFQRSFGFGIERMSPYPSRGNLLGWDDGDVPDQPGPRIAMTGSPGEWTILGVDAKSPLVLLHDQGLLGFLDSRRFGFFKDFRHVAGFQPHGFSNIPGWNGSPWKIQTLDLVGLLLEPEPRVYVSDKLPTMENVRDIPTRPLDKFEAVGLLTLQDGEDLMITRKGNAARMLGAIRSTKQCIVCHGGDRGDLLGAFSYTLQTDIVAGEPTHQ
jgi:hypothetical protein